MMINVLLKFFALKYCVHVAFKITKGLRKISIEGGGLPKKGDGAWTVCGFKGGLGWKNEGGGVFFSGVGGEGELIPQCTL